MQADDQPFSRKILFQVSTMKPFPLLTLPVLLLCGLSSHSAVQGDVVGRHHLKYQPETRINNGLQAILKKTIQTEEHEMQVKSNRHKEEEDPIDHHLDGRNDGLVSETENDFPCPLASSILPCVCSYDADYKVDLNCTEVESEDELAFVFMNEFPVTKLRSFHMDKNLKLKVIGDFLNGITFEEVTFNPGPFIFETFSEYFFLDNKDTLTKLIIYNSEITSDTFPFAVLGELKELEVLHIHGQFLTTLPKMLAPNLTNIDIDRQQITAVQTGTFPIGGDKWKLELDDNNISVIEPGSFYFTDDTSANSNEYLELHLDGNNLQSLEAGVFLVRNAPTVFKFQENQIASIEPGTFILPNETDHLSIEFNLDNNQLRKIDEEVFGKFLPFTTLLTISGNPLFCGCDIAWLILNPEYMTKIDTRATCEDGTNLHLMDIAKYESVCNA